MSLSERASLVLLGLSACLFCTSSSGQTPAPASPEGLHAVAIDPETRRQYEQYALTHQGDPAAGAKLFRDEKRTKCAACHRVKGEGGTVGPDLTSISGKFDRPHLIESLLEPSRQIVEGYRPSVLLLHDGRVQVGIVRERSADKLTVLDSAGKRKTIETADVDEQRLSAVSLMPAGLWEELSKEQFTDLIAYLETLQGPHGPKAGSGVVGRISLPDRFEIQAVATGITAGTALETLPDGRVLVCEQTGALRVVKDGQLLEEPMLSLDVESNWERGLIGVTVDPDFPDAPYLYVCYVAGTPYPHHRVSRFVVEGDTALPASEVILLKGDDQTSLGGKVPAGHQGGALHFGPDEKLYVAIGEQTSSERSQELDMLLGKILRINADGSIPTDNPFFKRTRGKYRAIWAMGLRNPFTFAFDDETGVMFVNDVGGKFEEINVVRSGANYGWPIVDHGTPHGDRFSGPIHTYPQSSIGGADFCNPEYGWPPEYHRRYFFADFVQGWVKTLSRDEHGDVKTFMTGVRRPTDLRFSRDGSLYVLLRNAWVIDDKFEPHTGTLMRVRYGGERPESHALSPSAERSP